MNSNLKADPSIDAHVVGDIVGYLLQEPPRSFFLYAGAGAGKTRTLVSVLEQLQDERERRMRLKSQQIAVITYTNAACDEIVHRLRHDPLFDVRTIHSFAWGLIQGFNSDIRTWLKAHLGTEIVELTEEQRKGRPGTKAAVERERSIHSKTERLGLLDQIRAFTYSPEGDNRDRDSLNHSEVIGLTSAFLQGKPLMQQLLICKYPILLIDESQDTNKHLIEALMEVQHDHADRFAVGLIGDTMQRIYTDGRADLAAIIPENWATPRLMMNHRSPVRVVQLINTIRSDADIEQQKCRSDALPGSVRLFLCPAKTANPEVVERNVRARMAEITNDPAWNNTLHVKTLILEHQMAARRMNFAELFEPLYRIETFRTGLLNGDLPLLAFFTDLLQPLVSAGLQKDQFKLTAILRQHSELLSEEVFQAAGANQPDSLRLAKTAVHQLLELWSGDGDPTLAQVLECVHSHRLFPIPDSLAPFVTPTEGDDDDEQEIGESQENEATANLAAIRACLQAPFSHVQAYHDYVTESATFDTHHGVKGREFDRVMVVINDAESRGFLFKYGALLGTKSASTSRGRSQEAKESSEDRTRRLFYVTCSRSKNSLAVVAYTENPEVVKTHALSKQWFEPTEIESINP
ncbi:MAG TPA: UvrD-helicase domain-containing protein [Planctomicrobium sp.]|nr:UvrD-helicase domain-containing protein [Planctomicrobium sp.]